MEPENGEKQNMKLVQNIFVKFVENYSQINLD